MTPLRPEGHEPLRDEPWDERRVRAAIAGVVAATEAALPSDGCGPRTSATRTSRSRRTRTRASTSVRPAWRGRSAGSGAPSTWRPWYGARTPGGPSYPRTVAGRHVRRVGLPADPRLRPARRGRVLERGEPDDEWVWGAPGTMLAAEAVPGCEDAWRASADALWRRGRARWRQHLPTRVDRVLGAAHGFVGNVRALAGRPDLLGAEHIAELEERTVNVLRAEALRDGDLANWPRSTGDRIQRSAGPVVPRCARRDHLDRGTDTRQRHPHGPARRRRRADVDRRPAQQGRQPLPRHGGQRLGVPQALEAHRRRPWLARARAFAMHALGQVDGGRFSLWTGDLGIALYLQACLDGDDGFPTIDVW